MFKPQKKPKGFGENKKRIELNNFNLKVKLEIANKKRINKEFIEAIENYKEIILVTPRLGEAHYNLGLCYKSLNLLDEAIESFSKVLQLEPQNISVHLLLGNIYTKLKDFKSAKYYYQKGHKLDPNDFLLLNGLGNVLHKENRYTEAINCFKTALKVVPNEAGILNNLGNSLVAISDFDEAIKNYCKAISKAPLIQQFHLNLGFAYFYNGNYEEGWKEYEHRTKYKPINELESWEGQPLRPEQKLLIYSEEGLGDTIQFLRYAMHLKTKGINFKLCIQDKLFSIVENTSLRINLIKYEQLNNEKFDFQVGLISLPRILKITKNKVIINDKYLSISKNISDKWKLNFKKQNCPVIGINWQGNPKAETNSGFGRSIALEQFSLLSTLPQIKFLSLQKTFGSEQLENCSFKDVFVDFQEEFNPVLDFLEYASVIENCDLVITTDTSTAHLAGSIGKKTWLILKKLPDWRWGVSGNATSWYKSIKIFRQTKPHSWSEVLEELKISLISEFKLLP